MICPSVMVPYDSIPTVVQVKEQLIKFGHPDDFYIVCNGKRLEDDSVLPDSGILRAIPRLCGGKGGFGSMLRAIGAQIEKTTNREACRDLSGRRLRDINEEQRLKNWINQQPDREKEARDRKQKKLERLCEKPKYEFKNEEYDKERASLPEKVEDAVLKGLEASCSNKRKSEDVKCKIKKKKPKLWLDDEIEEDISSSESVSESEEKEMQKIVTENEIKTVEESSPETSNKEHSNNDQSNSSEEPAHKPDTLGPENGCKKENPDKKIEGENTNAESK